MTRATALLCSTLLLAACTSTPTPAPDPLPHLAPAEAQELVDLCLRHAQWPWGLDETLRAELEFVGFRAELPERSCGLNLVPKNPGGPGALHRLQLELVPVSTHERTAILRVMHPIGGPTEHTYHLTRHGDRWDSTGPPAIAEYL